MPTLIHALPHAVKDLFFRAPDSRPQGVQNASGYLVPAQMPYPYHRPCPYSYTDVVLVVGEIRQRECLYPNTLLTGGAAVLLDAWAEREGALPSVHELYMFCPPESRPTCWLAAAYLQVWTQGDHSRMMRNGQDAYAYSKTIMEGVALYLDGNQQALRRVRVPPYANMPGYVQALTWILNPGIQGASSHMHYPDMLKHWQIYHLIDKITPQDVL